MQHPIGVCRLTGGHWSQITWAAHGPSVKSWSAQLTWKPDLHIFSTTWPRLSIGSISFVKKRGYIQSTTKTFHSKERQREISKAQNKKHHTFGTLRKCPTKMIWNIQSQSVLHISSWGHSLSRDNIISTCSFGAGGHQQVLNGVRFRKFVSSQRNRVHNILFVINTNDTIEK